MEAQTERDHGDVRRMDDDGLRAALQALTACRHWPGQPEWEAIGRTVMAVARREASGWPSHAQEFQSAFIDDAVKLLRRYPQTVIEAEHPWALLIARARRAARSAVAAESRVGIIDRDPISHRVRIATLATLRVSSYEVLADRIDTSPESRPA